MLQLNSTKRKSNYVATYVGKCIFVQHSRNFRIILFYLSNKNIFIFHTHKKKSSIKFIMKLFPGKLSLQFGFSPKQNKNYLINNLFSTFLSSFCSSAIFSFTTLNIEHNSSLHFSPFFIQKLTENMSFFYPEQFYLNRNFPYFSFDQSHQTTRYLSSKT